MSKSLLVTLCLSGWLLAVPAAPALPPADIAMGYLVDQNYALDADRKLSDWDIDARAGTVATGYWSYTTFTDTSTTAGFEMRKPFLPQSSGTVGVEFRFKVPTRTDGMVWAVRADRDNSLVEITTSGTKLGYRNTAGTFVPLQDYDTATVYTVHIDLNLPTATGTIYVNGVSLASGAIGRNTGLTQASQFYVGTPVAGTGTLWMFYVSIVKGYKVLERFTNATAGAVPANWTATTAGGTAAVQVAQGTNYKDQLSFRLQDTSASAACTLGRTFAASTSKLVWEYKFMLPTTQSGVRMQLRSGSTNAVTITTTATGLAYLDAAGAAVELWANYKPNLWYTVRVVADPATDTADLYVNGKRRATSAPFNGAVGSLDNVLFSSSVAATGTVWLDDVLVYDQQPEPADYVPAVRAVASRGKTVGMQTFFAGWREGQHAGWDWVYRYPNHDPYLGFADGGNPEVMDWQLKWMAESGVNFFLDCWYKNPTSTSNPITYLKEPLFEYTQGPLHSGYFYAKYSDKVKFAIADYSLDDTSAAEFESYILPYWIEYYFKDPRYYVIPGAKKGYPVVSMGLAVSWLSKRTDGSLKDSITKLRAALVAEGYDGVVVLAEYRYADVTVLTNLKNAGIDYVYAYWGQSIVSGTQTRLKNQLNAGTGPNPPLVVPIPDGGQGYSGEAWDLSNVNQGYTPLSDFAVHSTWMRDTFPTLTGVSGLGTNTVLYDNWNEFGEGHYIAPTYLQGFGYLDAIRAAYTTTPLSNDTPTPAQITRLNTLYARAWQGRQWAFDSLYADTEGWTAAYGVGNLTQDRGYLEGTFTNSDPSIVCRDGQHIDAAAYNRFKVRMKNSTGGTTAKLYFTTAADSTFDETKSVVFNLTPNDPNYTEYTVDLSGVTSWTGTIRQLRFDPVDAGAAAGQTFSIDSIKVVAAVNPGWEFNGTTTEGWTGAQINNLLVGGGTLQGSIAGTDPRVVSPDGLELNTATYRKVRVRLKNATAGSAAKLYFITTADGSYNEAKAKTVAITPNDPGFTEYTFDMNGVAGWNGTVRQLRLDPVDPGSSSGAFSIDYIRLVSPLALVGAAPGSFSAWQSANFTAAQLQSANTVAADAAPAGDGVANAMKYVFGLKPLAASILPIASGFETVNGSKRYVYKFTLPYNVPADVSLSLQVSAGMQSWSQAAYRPSRGCWEWDANRVLAVTERDTETGVEVRIVTNISSSTDRAAFLRLQASLE